MKMTSVMAQEMTEKAIATHKALVAENVERCLSELIEPAIMKKAQCCLKDVRVDVTAIEKFGGKEVLNGVTREIHDAGFKVGYTANNSVLSIEW